MRPSYIFLKIPQSTNPNEVLITSTHEYSYATLAGDGGGGRNRTLDVQHPVLPATNQGRGDRTDAILGHRASGVRQAAPRLANGADVAHDLLEETGNAVDQRGQRSRRRTTHHDGGRRGQGVSGVTCSIVLLFYLFSNEPIRSFCNGSVGKSKRYSSSRTCYT